MPLTCVPEYPEGCRLSLAIMKLLFQTTHNISMTRLYVVLPG